MKKVYCSVILIIVCLAITGCNQNMAENSDKKASEKELSSEKNIIDTNEIPKDKTQEKDKATIKEIDFSSYFNGYQGSAVFIDTDGNCLVYNKEEAESRYSPCSTFKIVSTLAAFEYKVITPTESLIEWDGNIWSFESWNKDSTITEAFKNSCVWYYRKLIDKIGNDKMNEFIAKIGYGNGDISQWQGSGLNGDARIDGFWLESSLLISPIEQADLMLRIFEGKTSISESNIVEVKKMMLKENDTVDAKVYGKTGSGKGAWFVGFFELDGKNTYFAVRLGQKDDEKVTGSIAQEIAFNIINGYFEK